VAEVLLGRADRCADTFQELPDRHRTPGARRSAALDRCDPSYLRGLRAAFRRSVFGLVVGEVARR
jgi:hypothetical protein